MRKRFQNNWAIWLLIFLFGALYSFFSISHHLRFQTFGFDLGIYDQEIWLFSQGSLFSSILDYPIFGDHFTPSLILLTPIYIIWNNVLALLLFQVFFASLGALPIYLLAKEKLKSQILALVLSLSYLLFFGLQNAIAFDFHPIVLAATLLAFLFYFFEKKSWFWFWPIFVLFLGLQENFSLLGIALGFYFMIQKRKLMPGLPIGVLSLLWFLVSVFVVIPHFREAPSLYLPSHLNNLGFLSALSLLFFPFSKIQVMFFSFLAFGFLPFLSPVIWIILLEEFFQRFVGNSSPNRWEAGYQYNVILAPVMSMGAILATEKLKNKKTLTIGLLLGGVILTQIFANPSLNQLTQEEFYDFSSNNNVKEVLKLIPSDASVAATNNLIPHLSHRRQIILLTNCLDDKTIWVGDMKRCFDFKPDYLAADLLGDDNNFYPDSKEKIEEYLEVVQKSGEYKLIKQEGTVYLLSKR